MDNIHEVFSNLKCRIPSIPVGLSSFKCESISQFQVWLNKFKEKYGDEGILHLDWVSRNQIEGNVNYLKACNMTAETIEKYKLY